MRKIIKLSRWHSWIAQPPPKGQVAGSNPARDANGIKRLREILLLSYLKFFFRDNQEKIM